MNVHYRAGLGGVPRERRPPALELTEEERERKVVGDKLEHRLLNLVEALSGTVGDLFRGVIVPEVDRGVLERHRNTNLLEFLIAVARSDLASDQFQDFEVLAEIETEKDYKPLGVLYDTLPFWNDPSEAFQGS